MRRILRTIAVAVACGSVALLGACTSDDESDAGPEPSASATLTVNGEAPAPLLTAEEVLAATGETTDKVTIGAGLASGCAVAGGLIADVDEVENPWGIWNAWTAEAHYMYWNPKGARVELNECLYRTDSAEAQQMFDLAGTSGRLEAEDLSVYELTSVGDESLVFEGYGPGDQLAVARTGDTILAVTVGASAIKMGSEAAHDPGPVLTRQQFENLVQAAVEKLAD